MHPKTIHENYHLRTEPPIDVWDFFHYSSWKTNFWFILKNTLPSWLITHSENNLDFIEFIETAGLDSDNFFIILQQNLPYKFIRVAHATRTSSIDQFYNLGLLPLNTSNAEIRLKNIFLDNPEFPEITFEKIMCAVTLAKNDLPLRENRAYFTLSESTINGKDCDFLKSGSEFLNVLALYLSNSKSTIYQEYLKTIPNEKATIFICDVEINSITNPFEILKIACNMIINEYLNHQKYPDYFCEESAIWTSKATPPLRIIGHYHPEF